MKAARSCIEVNTHSGFIPTDIFTFSINLFSHFIFTVLEYLLSISVIIFVCFFAYISQMCLTITATQSKLTNS